MTPLLTSVSFQCFVSYRFPIETVKLWSAFFFWSLCFVVLSNEMQFKMASASLFALMRSIELEAIHNGFS